MMKSLVRPLSLGLLWLSLWSLPIVAMKITATESILDTELGRKLLEKAVLLPKRSSSSAAADETPEYMHMFRSLEEGNDDDYFLDDADMLDFSGFSIKYAKCQTIQRFSEDAIKNGEYSAMVKDDIVILRLCPNSQCSANKQYGCRYNYLEYAIGVADYVTFMLKYTIDKKNKMCTFCQGCGYSNNNNNKDNRSRRRREGEEGNEGNNNNNEHDQQEGNNEQQDQNQELQDDDFEMETDDNAKMNDDFSQAAVEVDDDVVDICDTYASNCEKINNWCNGVVDDDVGYLAYEDYFNYLDCVKIASNDANYWIRPRCDPYKETIHMDIYYDPYCSQYAGNDVNLREVSGIFFQQSVFAPFYNGTCIDCSQSEDGPYYDANSIMCNRVYKGSAKCTKQLMYQFDQSYDTSSNKATQECSFIESVRVGTYNQKGEIYVDSALYGDRTKMEVTSAQQAGLAISILLCVILGVYSCYLHHSITNLLIKSLSHSHLLPPSRHRNRNRAGRKHQVTPAAESPLEDVDWDHNTVKVTLT